MSAGMMEKTMTTAIIGLAEGVTEVSTPSGSELSYAIIGGADSALFEIDPVTGALRFVAAPDFEAPSDADGDNRYEVEVEVSDGVNITRRSVTATITDVDQILQQGGRRG